MNQTILDLFYTGDYNEVISCLDKLDPSNGSPPINRNETLSFRFRSLVHLDRSSDALDLLPNNTNSVTEALRLYLQAYQLGLLMGNPFPVRDNQDFNYQNHNSSPEWNHVVAACSDLLSSLAASTSTSSSSPSSPSSNSQTTITTFILAVVMDWAGRPDLSFQLSTRSFAQCRSGEESTVRAEAALLQCSLLAQRGHWEILEDTIRGWRRQKSSPPIALDSLTFQILEAQILILKSEPKRALLILCSLNLVKKRRSPKILGLLITASIKMRKFADCELFLDELKATPSLSSFYWNLLSIYSIQYQKLTNTTPTFDAGDAASNFPPLLIEWKKNQLAPFQ